MSKYIVNADWNSAPHLSENQKAELLKTIRPHQRRAREQGLPVLGAGAIYPVDEDSIKCKPFELPRHWRRSYALDVGWKRTAALWGAWDEESDCLYLYSEHYVAEAQPPIHADAIKARGAWMHGVVDPASHGRTQDEGVKLFDRYIALGLKISNAENAIDAGLDAVWERMVAGRLKVFSTLSNWFYEFRLYRRDEKGRIVKKDDHLMDCTRYLTMSGEAVARGFPGSFTNRSVPAIVHATEWNMLDQLVKEDKLH